MPIKAAYCHCESCRRAHASPLYQCVYVPATQFRIAHGAELVNNFTKPGAECTRSFCTHCRSKITIAYSTANTGFFPALLEECM
jgi:hypothetical protein